jgi:peptide/nickel transport system permease protein
MRRLARDPVVLIALGVLAALAAAAIFAPFLTSHNPAQQIDIVRLKSRPPSAAFPFGTDPLSRDVLSRVLYGGRVSLSVGLLAALGSLGIGTAYGAIAGYAGGVVDEILMRTVDALMAMPRVLLVLTVIALWGGTSPGALIAFLAGTGWFQISRLVRAEVKSAGTREFAIAARALGATDSRVLARHILPNAMSPMIVAATISFGTAILLEAGLSFIGVGIQPPRASWGNIMHDATGVRLWWLSLFPGLAIVATMLAITVLGDRLRDALDPRDLPPL